MKCTDILKHEHQVILLVVDAAVREAQSMERTRHVHGERVRQMLDVFRNFVDKCHHTKEERHLFPALQRHGLGANVGPIAVMLAEHNEGRARIRSVSEALSQAESGAKEALSSIGYDLMAYAVLLRNHIDKENNILFVMAGRLLSTEEDDALVKAFDDVELAEMGPGVHEKYHQLAHELAES
jgi:hemerythrin-like domain-containing protein